MPQNIARSKVLDAVRASPGNRVKVAVSDIDGVLRGKYLHKDKFFSAAEGGFGFCDVVFGWDMNDQCYDNTTLTGWHKGFPDALARIDLGTLPQRAVGRRRAVLPRRLRRAEERQGGAASDLSAAAAEARAQARREARRRADVRHGIRVVQLRRDAAVVGRQGLRAAADDHAGHVRLFAAARQPEPRVLQGADGRNGRIRHPDRRLAHRRPVPASTRRRSCSPRRSKQADRAILFKTGRQGDRLALRHHAELHGQVERAVSGLLRAHPPVAVRRQEEPVSTMPRAATA